jgi:hypothetical protein
VTNLAHWGTDKGAETLRRLRARPDVIRPPETFPPGLPNHPALASRRRQTIRRRLRVAPVAVRSIVAGKSLWNVALIASIGVWEEI